MARPKGFADWSPTPAVQVTLDQIQSVLEEYRNYLPMTARQIFYRMVGRYGYEKTEQAYARLSGYLVRARRARIISFRDIRDDGTTQLDRHESVGSLTNFGGHTPESYLNDIRGLADAYFRDRMEPQPHYVEVWCEAAGMAPQLARVCHPYGITVYSTGGFSSVTVTYEIAQRATINSDKETYLLHIGDYDPSGVSLYEVMIDDAQQFTWGLSYRGERCPGLHGVRVALLPEQIEEHDIPTAPPKSSDTRSVNWLGDTAQAEAMPPDLLAQTLDGAIRQVIDTDLMEETIAEEDEERERLREKLESLEWDEGEET